MRAIALVFCAALIACGIGRLVVDRFSVLKNYPLERFAFAASIGLGTASYGVYALGLLGYLSFWPITTWWILIGLIGLRGIGRTILDFRAGLYSLFRRESNDVRDHHPKDRWMVCLCAVILVSSFVIALTAAFQPPGGHEWDALAYHLADPKIFLQQHRISFLPTQHHSNFPFTMEMLFACGLLYGGPQAGYVVANLFHLLTAFLLVIGIIASCKRLFSSFIGWMASAILMTTPVVLWESGIAYSDIGLTLFVTLSVICGLSAIHTRNGHVVDPAPVESTFSTSTWRDPEQWALLAGVMMGWALGIKYTAGVYFVILGALMVLRRMTFRGIAIYGVTAVCIGAPWYIKNVVLTSNPVYPFASHIFSHSRYWTVDRAVSYQGEQDGFGYPHSLIAPVESFRNLIDTPWQIVAHPIKYGNPGDATLTFCIGGLFTALCLAAAVIPFKPDIMRNVMWLITMESVAWFFMAQFIRYLIPVLPLCAIAGGWIGARFLYPLQICEVHEETCIPQTKILWRYYAVIPFSLVLGQFAVLLWSVLLVPVSGMEALHAGLIPTAFSVPDNIRSLVQPGGPGIEAGRSIDNYPAMIWINQNTPKEAGVVLYDDVRGFYLDRPYLWGNAGHSSYIPYNRFTSGDALTEWLMRHGIRYAIININWAGDIMNLGRLPIDLQEAAARVISNYRVSPGDRSHWSDLVRDAMRTGKWKPVFAQRNVMVWQLESGEGSGKTGE